MDYGRFVPGNETTIQSAVYTVVEVMDDSRPLRRAAFYMKISNDDLGQFYHTERPHLRTARWAHPSQRRIARRRLKVKVNSSSSFSSMPPTRKVASNLRLINKTTGRNSHKITDISWLEVVDSLVNSKVELLYVPITA